MTPQPVYVLDANVFIEAAKGYYAFDLAPAFWDSLLTHGTAGRLCTIDRIADEIKNEDLKTWMDQLFISCVKSSGEREVISYYSSLMEWTQAQQFTDAAKAEFASVADAWLVEYAKATGGIVVTHERYEPERKNKVKIPNACRFITVPCVDTFAMMRALSVKL